MNNSVLLEQQGAVATIVLNRPESLNAMNLELIDGLQESVKKCAAPTIRTVVIRGSGRCFSAGGDIRLFQQMLQQGAIPEEMPDHLHTMIEGLRALEKPVIASVHGAAAGAGTSLALACDLVIASDDATFNLAYTRIGLSPDGSSSYFLPRHVGMKKAMEIFLLNGNLKASEALDLGLINWVVSAPELSGKTDELARRLASGPTAAYGRVKQLVAQGFSNSLHDQLALETRLICDSSRTDDFREGIGSFLEKRAPVFKGR